MPTTFEECCAIMGCSTTEATRACMELPAAYGTCSVGGVPGACVATASCSGAHMSTPGFCPGPTDIQCCTDATVTPADAGMGSTDAGTFTCNEDDRPTPNSGIMPELHHARCPIGSTLVTDTLCVDVYEGFLREVVDGGTAEWSPFFNPGTRTMLAVSAAGAVPQGYIHADQAEAACNRAGKRLCTNTEWLRACRGPDSLTYPYGNTRMNGVCNDARTQHPAIQLFPDDPTPFDRIQSPCLNQLPAGLDRTGARAGCITAEGVMDMMGNLHEWTSDEAGTFRGGFYVDTRINGNGCLYLTTAHNRVHWDYSTGFRCCADALP